MHQNFCPTRQDQAQIGTKAPKGIFHSTKWEVAKYGDISAVSAGNFGMIGLTMHRFSG